DFRGVGRSLFHGLIFSRVEASTKPGAVHLAGFIMLIFFTYLDLASTAKVDLESTAIIASSFALAFALTIPYIRMDIGHPRDQPIRFNRHRRKVYFYQYRFDRLNPFGHKNWGVKPVAYDWDDLTAEVYSIYAPLGYGGLLENVMISVRKPGTDEVIDRVFFTSDIEQGKQYWAITRLFMQQGAEALPDFVYPPTDWNSEDLANPFERLAPKVQWPADMDLESRTAPSEGDHQ
ncbi:DUF6708 domain-containing protein, partial [Pseudomonas guariconensis]